MGISLERVSMWIPGLKGLVGKELPCGRTTNKSLLLLLSFLLLLLSKIKLTFLSYEQDARRLPNIG